MIQLYLAGPMRNIPFFNFPAFEKATAFLRHHGHVVFSPAEHDDKMHGSNFSDSNPTGDNIKAQKEFGFSLRRALGADLDWICREADGIALLPGWEKSKGALAEKATAEALGLIILYLKADSEGNYYFNDTEVAA